MLAGLGLRGAWSEMLYLNGGAMDGFADLLGWDSFLFQHLTDDLDDRLSRAVTGCQLLTHRETAGVRIQDDNVGKRSADIDADLIFIVQHFPKDPKRLS